jgi:hypothetical protein
VDVFGDMKAMTGAVDVIGTEDLKGMEGTTGAETEENATRSEGEEEE